MARIFIYGTLKKGGCRSHVLHDQRLLAEAKTVPKYRMYNTGTYPALVENEDGVAVEGEIWEIDDSCLRVLDAIECIPSLYDRKPVVLETPDAEVVETYIYQWSVEGMADCGGRWDRDLEQSAGQRNQEVAYLADLDQPAFETDRMLVDVVCAGDSITGWNNFGPVRLWPYPTYPQFLHVLCDPPGLKVADGGIAGEISGNGLVHVSRYLDLFPNSRYFIIGFGTNDLGTWTDTEAASRRIIENLAGMAQAVRDRQKQPIFFNIPYANESMFPPQIAKDTHRRRDYHNTRLTDYCRRNDIPLADICSHLRDQHFGDELHPNEFGARVIAERVFQVLAKVHRP